MEPVSAVMEVIVGGRDEYTGRFLPEMDVSLGSH